jgi:membrane glycosyltransferase
LYQRHDGPGPRRDRGTGDPGAAARRRANEPFWYRRRRENTQKKQGNINDFVQRWGGRYEYMLELDADSFVSPEAMLELVRRMDARPRTALIQSLPIIVGARTYSARCPTAGAARTWRPVRRRPDLVVGRRRKLLGP